MLTNLFSESPGRGAKNLVITKRSAAGLAFQDYTLPSHLALVWRRNCPLGGCSPT